MAAYNVTTGESCGAGCLPVDQKSQNLTCITEQLRLQPSH